jgi:hypothetical protein
LKAQKGKILGRLLPILEKCFENVFGFRFGQFLFI